MPHKDPIVRAAYQAEYRQKHAERLRRNGFIYRAAHHEELLEGKKRHYRENETAYRERSKKHWHSRPYWFQRFHHAKGKAIRRGVYIGDLNALAAYYREVFSRPSAVCSYCRGEFPIGEIVLDHKEPLSRGGSHEVSNLMVSCVACNYEKRAKPFALWQAMI